METLRDYHFPPEKDKMKAIKKYWAGEKPEDFKEVDLEAKVKEVDEENKNIEYLLKAFEKFKVKFVPVFENITEMANKRKFQGIFDKIIIGGAANIQNAGSYNALGKENSTFIVENVK